MWVSVTLETDAEHAEVLADALLAAGAISASVEDAWANTEQETPQFGEPGSPTTPLWEVSRVAALFEPAEDLIGRIAAAAVAAGIDDLPEMTLDEVAEQDWVRLTQSQFEPIRIHERLWIVPSWHVAPDPTAINLILDPGLAFGTGSHPTTFLCLDWLVRNLRAGETVLDYGCGSGILAIAAARLGADAVLGVDIDANALLAAHENAAANAVTVALQHSREPIARQFDVLVANILTNPLCVLAPLLVARLARGGRFILSGILAAQAEQVIAVYASGPVPLLLEVGAERDTWVRLEGRLPC